SRRAPRLEQLRDPRDVADPPGHLRAAEAQVVAVHPGPDEGLPGRRLALGDLVLVVRKDQLPPARVDVKRLAEVLHAHRRALDVPAGAPAPDGRIPGRLAPPGALSPREGAHGALGAVGP